LEKGQTMSNHAYRTKASYTFIFACCLVVLAAKDGRAQLVTGRAPVGNFGHELYYEIQGSGEPVVLIHGMTLDSREWDAQVEALAEKYQVIRYDVVGHGRSSGMSSDLPDGAVRDWDFLRELLDEIGVDKAHVVGLSMGGEIALNFALEYSERVQTLTPIDARLPGYDLPSDSELGNRFNNYINVSSSQGVQAALPLWAADPLFGPARANPEVAMKLEEIVVQGHGALGDGARFQWPNLLKVASLSPSTRSRLNEIDIPTLVMIGELDLVDFQIQSDIIDRDIPNSMKLVVPGAGHMSDMENPDFVNAALLDFFAAHPMVIVPEPSAASVLFVGAMAIAACYRVTNFRLRS
jgi:pimeloyl-ACP methyl ester carboxylesterase